MRNFINIMDQAYNKSSLLESILLEYHDFGQTQLAPAFAALYEQERKKQRETAVTDRILTDILAKHNNDISAAVAAIKQHKEGAATSAPSNLTADPSSRLLAPDQHKSAVQKVRHALEQWHNLANRKQPLVPDADKFLDAKTDEVASKLDAVIAPNSKWAALKPKIKRTLDKLKEISKAHPRKSAWIVAAVGVISGLVTNSLLFAGGATWLPGAVTMIMRMLMMIWQGESFGTALRKSLASGALGLIAGVGIFHAWTAIDAWLNSAQAAPASTSLDALSQTDSVRELPVNTPGAPAADAANPVATTPYTDQLRQIVDPTGEGRGIPTMNQSTFGDAFRAAREAMGPGNIFAWNGNVYTTNTAGEGLLSGLSDAAKRFLRGAR